MITLITGRPGSGKTAYVVGQMMEVYAKEPDTIFFADGIKDLKLPITALPPIDEWTKMTPDPDSSTGEEKPFYQFPPRSILVIDECQYLFRSRSAGSPVPQHVAALETHRHTGIDIWLITQQPGRLDNIARGLVNKHIALRNAGILGRYLYEWTDQIGDPESPASREIAAKRKYKLPKKAFEMYKSAEVHTKQSKRIPTSVIVAGVAVVSVFGTGIYAYTIIDDKLSPDSQISALDVLPDELQEKEFSLGGVVGGQPKELTYMEAFTPRIIGMPHTSPAYDSISYSPQSAPFPAACIASSENCYCYTNQSTKIAMDDSMCRSIVKEGLYDLSRAAVKPEPVRLKDSPDISAQEDDNFLGKFEVKDEV